MKHPPRAPHRARHSLRGPWALASGLAALVMLVSCTSTGPAAEVADSEVSARDEQTDEAVVEPDPDEAAGESDGGGSEPSTTTTPSEETPDEATEGGTEEAVLPEQLDVTRLATPVSTVQFEESGDDDAAAWQAALPEIQDVTIPSSQDGAEQGAFWLPPAGADQPLLVVLHSWSSPYQQQLNIPYGVWARENGWGMIVPDFRGINERPESTASELAVADVLDAVDYGLAEGDGDEDLVYAIGFSGGGMMSLVMAGRAPERFAGVVAWVPIFDLREWYARKVGEDPEGAYVGQIEGSCGGPPVPGTPAAEECASRSPATLLGAAATAGIPVYIGAGLSDDNVPASDAAQSFNALVEGADRLDDGVVSALRSASLPGGTTVDPAVETFFGPEQPEVLLARRSASTTLVIFEGEHEMLYDPGLQWMARRTPTEG